MRNPEEQIKEGLCVDAEHQLAVNMSGDENDVGIRWGFQSLWRSMSFCLAFNIGLRRPKVDIKGERDP
jgi:hypothetical protein